MSSTDPASWTRRLPPAVAALAVQCVALIAAASLAMWFRAGPLPAWIALSGLLAALLSRRLHLPLWWQFIGLIFLPLLWLTLQSGIEPAWFLAAFLLLLLTSLGAIRGRVPLYLSSPSATAELAARLPDRARVLDLGCGLGGPLASLSALRPDATLQGVEAAPLNWLIAHLRLMGRAHIRLGDLWNADLSRQDVVYAYLSPAPMARLWEKACSEMLPGSLFISNSFSIPGVEPDEVVELHDLTHARLLIWRMR